MTSNGQRILTGVVAIPLLIVIVLFLPQYHHLVFCLLVLAVCGVASGEMHQILVHDKDGMKLPMHHLAGLILPITAYIQYSLDNEFDIILYSAIFVISLIFLIETMTGHKDNFIHTRDRISYTLVQFLYPNLFAIFLIRLCFLDQAYMWLLSFFLLVFGSDTFAYFAGRLFGKNNKGIVAVSPNKSLAGFAAGLFVPAIMMSLLTAFIDAYGLSWWQGLIIGLGTAFAAICGDLIESAFKRSSELKDSGHAIPGRGGMLDSIDSICVAAPIYMSLLHIFLASTL